MVWKYGPLLLGIRDALVKELFPRRINHELRASLDFDVNINGAGFVVAVQVAGFHVCLLVSLPFQNLAQARNTPLESLGRVDTRSLEIEQSFSLKEIRAGLFFGNGFQPFEGKSA